MRTPSHSQARALTRALSRAALLVSALAAAGCRAGQSGAGAASSPAQIRPPASARDLVQHMHGRWGGRWYRTLAWTQKNTITAAGREQRSEWREYQAVPGRLRIDFVPLDQRSGSLFVDNVQRTYTNGRVTDTRPLVHGLLLLSADVYATPVAQTMRMLDSLHIDTTKFYATRGVRQMYVVGAAPGDTLSSQVWVDGDSLLLRRFVQRSTNAAGRTTVADTRITYQAVDGVPVPREIVFFRNGAPYWRQEYTQVRVNPELPAELFDPQRWTTATRP